MPSPKKSARPKRTEKPTHAPDVRSAREVASVRMLERLSREITASLNLEDVCLAIYRGACQLMDCDAFFVALYEEDFQRLNFILRMDQGIQLPPLKILLDDGLTSQVIRSRKPVNLSNVDLQSRFKISHWGVGSPTQSLVCVPMILRNRVIGALSAQSVRTDAYDQVNLDIAMTLGAQGAIALENARLYAESQHKMKQLQALNQVGRIVSSTLEINQLLDLLYEQLQRIFRADTYYVTMYDAPRRMQRIEVIVDEGVRYPPMEIPLDDGLAAWVIERRAPLLVRNLLEEKKQRGLNPRTIGSTRLSESWLGVPLVTAEHTLGMLAIASYTPDAFDEDDQEVLQNIAVQAAITIDNARHHAVVEDQARRDSLTQVFNHGHFIRSLQTEMSQAQESHSPIALIMLDIDHFKLYNDQYGHLAGDAILRGTVQAIQSNVKSTDLVGRWGGEEFGIALMDSDASVAAVVAERIRVTLAEMKMRDDQDRPVPAPTVSQGIAIFPVDASHAFALVDAADRRLYRAKARGRDQIETQDI